MVVLTGEHVAAWAWSAPSATIAAARRALKPLRDLVRASVHIHLCWRGIGQSGGNATRSGQGENEPPARAFSHNQSWPVLPPRHKRAVVLAQCSSITDTRSCTSVRACQRAHRTDSEPDNAP